MSGCPTPEKLRFTSKRAAAATRRAWGGRVRAYPCRCGGWHLTTTTQDGRKRG